MPYLVSSIIAVVSAMIILLTRYEADDSSITGELDRVKSMFVMVDGFVNTYIQSGGDLTKINFQVLYDNGILSGNIDKNDIDPYVEGAQPKDTMESTLVFPESEVKLHLIPVRNIPDEEPEDEDENKNFGSSAGSAYKLLVNMRKNSSLMSKARFSESFAGREFCEKLLFGTVQYERSTYDSSDDEETFKNDGTKDDGIFVCVIFK